MSAVTQKRLSVIINIAYFALILALFYLVFNTFFGLLVPFITAFVVAFIFDRPVSALEKKLHVKRSITSIIFVVLALAVVVGLFFLIGVGIFTKLKEFFGYISDRIQNSSDLAIEVRDWAVNFISFLPEKLRVTATNSINSFFNNIMENGISGLSIGSFDWSSLISKGGGVIKDTVVQIPTVLIGIVISIIASVFMLSDFDNIKAFIMRQFSDRKREKIHEAKVLAVTTLRKMAKAYGLIILITTTELTIGFYILKFCKIFDSEYIFLLAIIIAIIDIIPVLGTGTVLIPWAVYSFITGDIALGIGLIIIYAVILVIRQIIEPKLVAGQVGLSPIVTIIAMYIGTKTIGVLGFFILPFIVILIKKFNDAGIIHLFKNEDALGASEKDIPEEPAVKESAVAENN